MLEKMILRPAEFAAVAGGDHAHSQVMLPVKRQHIVVYQCGGIIRLLASVQESKGIDKCM